MDMCMVSLGSWQSTDINLRGKALEPWRGNTNTRFMIPKIMWAFDVTLSPGF